MKTPYVSRFHSKLEKQSQKLALCTVNSTMQCLQKEQLYLSKWYMLGRGNRKKAAQAVERGVHVEHGVHYVESRVIPRSKETGHTITKTCNVHCQLYHAMPPKRTALFVKVVRATWCSKRWSAGYIT